MYQFSGFSAILQCAGDPVQCTVCVLGSCKMYQESCKVYQGSWPYHVRCIGVPVPCKVYQGSWPYHVRCIRVAGHCKTLGFIV